MRKQIQLSVDRGIFLGAPERQAFKLTKKFEHGNLNLLCKKDADFFGLRTGLLIGSSRDSENDLGLNSRFKAFGGHTLEIRILTSLIAKVLGEKPENVTVETTSDQISNWDSLGHIQILQALDENFDEITMKSPALASSTSVKEIYSLLTEAGV